MKKPLYVTEKALKTFIKNAFEEDIQDGDHSTLSTIPKDLQQKAKLLVKEDCILAGVELAEIIFKQFDKNLIVERLLKDGDSAKVGDIAFYVTGSARSIHARHVDTRRSLGRRHDRIVPAAGAGQPAESHSSVGLAGDQRDSHVRRVHQRPARRAFRRPGLLDDLDRGQFA